jgi:hypothetical protein
VCTELSAIAVVQSSEFASPQTHEKPTCSSVAAEQHLLSTITGRATSVLPMSAMHFADELENWSSRFQSSRVR